MPQQISKETIGGEETVEITTTGGHRIFLDDLSGVIIFSTSGGLRIILDDRAGEVTFESPLAINLNGQDIVIRSNGDLSLESSGQVDIQGAPVRIN